MRPGPPSVDARAEIPFFLALGHVPITDALSMESQLVSKQVAEAVAMMVSASMANRNDPGT